MNANKIKGTNAERQVKTLVEQLGFSCRKIPRSGQCQGFKGDLEIQLAPGTKYSRVEVKVRGKGFDTLYKWLVKDNARLLIFRKTSKSEKGLPFLVTLRLEDFLEICKTTKK